MSWSKLWEFGDGQGSLACCRPWGGKEADTTERLNNNKAALAFANPPGEQRPGEGEGWRQEPARERRLLEPIHPALPWGVPGIEDQLERAEGWRSPRVPGPQGGAGRGSHLHPRAGTGVGSG